MVLGNIKKITMDSGIIKKNTMISGIMKENTAVSGIIKKNTMFSGKTQDGDASMKENDALLVTYALDSIAPSISIPNHNPEIIILKSYSRNQNPHFIIPKS